MNKTLDNLNFVTRSTINCADKNSFFPILYVKSYAPPEHYFE